MPVKQWIGIAAMAAALACQTSGLSWAASGDKTGKDAGKQVEMTGRIVNKGGGYVLMTPTGEDWDIKGAKEDLGKLHGKTAKVAGTPEKGSAYTGAQDRIEATAITPVQE